MMRMRMRGSLKKTRMAKLACLPLKPSEIGSWSATGAESAAPDVAVLLAKSLLSVTLPRF